MQAVPEVMAAEAEVAVAVTRQAVMPVLVPVYPWHSTSHRRTRRARLLRPRKAKRRLQRDS